MACVVDDGRRGVGRRMPVDQQRLGVRQGAASSRALLRNGWKCFEAPGVEPVFLDQEQAIDYATGRACFRSGEIRILDSSGSVSRIIQFTGTGMLTRSS